MIAGRVVERLAGEFGAYVDIEPVLWEHEPLRATGHFQEQIVLPSKTDVVVCILWSRLGTRLPEGFAREDGTAYASGTEWEFEDAARSYREQGAPDLLVYRKTREAVVGLGDEAAILERLKQRKALDAFIERWFGSAEESFKAAFHAFASADEFEVLLETHLRKLIAEHLPEPLTGADEDAAPISWHQGSPFRGLEAFEFEHGPVFFGRTRAVGEVKQAIETRAAQGTAFLMVFGMSGSGKSSVLRAGLLPTVSQPGVVEGIGLWRWCAFRPSDVAGDLFEGLAQALMDPTALPELTEMADTRLLASYFRNAPEDAVQPITNALQRAATEAGLATGAEARLALVVDQMEELFTHERVDDEVRARFIAVLVSLAKGGMVWVIGAMRSDFYHRCAEAPELVALSEGAGQYHLIPPSHAEIAQIIRNPARAAGLRYEIAAETGERLDDVLHAAAARDPAALPLLEFTLEELFKLRREDGVLTFAAYEQMGGLEGAIGRRAEEVFRALTADVQSAFPAVLRQLVAIGGGTEAAVTSRAVSLEVIASGPERRAVVDALIEARLLVTDQATKGGTAVARVAHEALLQYWPRAAGQISKERRNFEVRTRLEEATRRWMEHDREGSLLLPPGVPLGEASELLESWSASLDQAVIEFIETSVASGEKRFEVERERERQVRRRLNLRRFVAATVVLLTVLLLIPELVAPVEIAKARYGDAVIRNFQPFAPEQSEVVVIAIDEETLLRMNYESPVDRLFLAELLGALDDAGVLAVGLDLLFDRHTEKAKDTRLRSALDQMRAPVVVAWPPDEIELAGPRAEFVSTYLQGVPRGHAALGRDFDGTVRWIPGQLHIGGEVVAGFAGAIAETVGAPAPKDPVALTFRLNEETRPGGVVVAGFTIFPAYLVQLLPPAWLSERIVLVGSVLPGEGRFRTPLGLAPSVVIHAHAVSQLVEEGEPEWAIRQTEVWLETAIVVLSAVLPTLLFLSQLALKRIGATAIVIVGVFAVALPAGYWFASYVLIMLSGLLLPLIQPTIAFLGMLIACSIYFPRQRERIRLLIKSGPGQKPTSAHLDPR